MERFNFAFAPYDCLSPNQQQLLQSSIQIVFFDDNATIIAPGDKLDVLYVIIKGMVQALSDNGDILALYHPQDSFSVRAMFEENSTHPFIAAEQCLLYAIPKSTIMALIQQNDSFGAYFYGSIADRLAAAKRPENDLTHVFVAKVFDAYRDNCIWVKGDDTLAHIAQTMKQNKAKSVLLTYHDKIGLMTESIFRDIVAGGLDGQAPAHQWATFTLIGIDVEDFLFDALLKMMHHRIQRLVVMQGKRVVGLLEQMDILAYLSNHSHLIAEELEQANSLAQLANIAQRFTEVISLLHKSGMQATQLARLMQVLNARLFEKAWQMIAPPEIVAQTCLVVMGSEGRGEQILKTDQDNALIATPNVDMTALGVYANAFSHALADFGYPPCQGNIMVNHPLWCQTLPNFITTITHWCKNPTPQHLMYLAIFMDAKAVAGDNKLLYQVKLALKQHLDGDIGIQRAFAQATLQFDEHGRGFFAKMLGKKDDKHLMDIKKMGIFPIVHGTRALSLSSQDEQLLDTTSTFERLNLLGQKNIITPKLAKDTSEALGYLMNLRLKTHLWVKNNQANTPPNQLDMQHLSTLERDLLKDTLQVVRRFKHEISTQFGLSYS